MLLYMFDNRIVLKDEMQKYISNTFTYKKNKL